MRSLVTASVLLILSTAAWTTVMLADPSPRAELGVLAMGISLWVATVTSIVGMVISRSRWARRTGVAITAGHAVVALIWPSGTLWTVAAALSVVTAVAVTGPWLRGIVRSLPAASGPPARAVLVPLVLLAVPFVGGAADGKGIWFAVSFATALLSAFWFIRTFPGAMIAVRVVWPAIALATAWPIGGSAGVVLALGGVAVAVLAWDKSVTRAVIPLVEKGSVVPIPPELAPSDVLDAAGIDDRGRPL